MFHIAFTSLHKKHVHNVFRCRRGFMQSGNRQVWSLTHFYSMSFFTIKKYIPHLPRGQRIFLLKKANRKINELVARPALATDAVVHSVVQGVDHRLTCTPSGLAKALLHKDRGHRCTRSSRELLKWDVYLALFFLGKHDKIAFVARPEKTTTPSPLWPTFR